MRRLTCFMPYANNNDADQPAHPRSLIRAFVVRRCLDSIIAILSKSDFKTQAGRFACYLVGRPERGSYLKALGRGMTGSQKMFQLNKTQML